jgi:hypothetical protein
VRRSYDNFYKLFQNLKTSILKNVQEKSISSKKGDEIGRLDGIVTNEKGGAWVRKLHRLDNGLGPW